MKNSPKEMADMILGLPRVSRELKNNNKTADLIKHKSAVLYKGVEN